jgi:hypothetical protein
MISNDATRAVGGALPMITSLDDIQAEVWNLFHLLDATRDVLMEMDYPRENGARCALDKVASLNAVARHFAEAIGAGIDENYQAIKTAAQSSAVQP